MKWHLVLFLIIGFHSFGQKRPGMAFRFMATITYCQVDTMPTFKNQGEQEEHWTKELFAKVYVKKEYIKYPGKIEMLNEHTFGFGKKVMTINDPTYLGLFKLGILYPGLFPVSEALGDTLKITIIKELKNMESGPCCKRFTFWIYSNKILNPQAGFFELTNKKAMDSTPLKEFIEGSKLTFIKDGWIVI